MANVQEVRDINRVPTAVRALQELKQLQTSSPDLFPSVEERGQAAVLAITGFNRLRQFAGGAIVDEGLAKLKALRATIVPIIKAFGDTGNIAVREAEVAAEALGLAPTSRESAQVQIEIIFKGLAAGVRARGVNPTFLTDAETDIFGAIDVLGADADFNPLTGDVEKVAQ